MRPNRGRWNISFRFTVVSGLAALGVNSPFLLTQIKQSFTKCKPTESSRYKELTEVHTKLNGLINEVTRDLRLPNEEKILIEPYLTDYPFCVSNGSLSSGKLLLGVPLTYLADNKEHIPSIVENKLDENVDWNSNLGKEIAEAFILSKEGKKFDISQLIHQKCTEKLWQTLNSYCFSSVIVFIAIIATRYILSPHKTPLMVPYKAVSYLFAAYIAYFIINNRQYQIYMETQISADRYVSQISNHYLKGSRDFFNYVFVRNEAMMKIPIYYCTLTLQEIKMTAFLERKRNLYREK